MERIIARDAVKFIGNETQNLLISYGIVMGLEEANSYYDLLEKEITYLEPFLTRISIGGKSYDSPRDIAAYGDPYTTYTYSNVELQAEPYTPTLIKIKSLVENSLGLEFNFVLVNRYVDGTRTIGLHSDDERELEKNYPIVSMSFGATRTFHMVHKYDASIPNVRIKLESGSILILSPPTNRFWKHKIGKELRVKTPRINLTWRRLKM